MMADSTISDLLKKHEKQRDKSRDTHDNVHKPALLELQKPFNPANQASPASVTSPNLSNAGQVILLGSSGIELFKTTGRDTQIANRPNTFNAGCSGDTIENVLYRLRLGLLDLIQPLFPKLWVVHIGTNNLLSNKPLQKVELDNYRLLLRALFSVSPPKARVLAVAIFKRKDRDDDVVRVSNEGIKKAVEDVNGEEGRERVRFVEQPEELGGEHMADHLHFNEEGYDIWGRVLAARVEEVLGEL